MIGNKDKGLGLIQQTGIGYIIIQMTPLLIKLIIEGAKNILKPLIKISPNPILY